MPAARIARPAIDGRLSPDGTDGSAICVITINFRNGDRYCPRVTNQKPALRRFASAMINALKDSMLLPPLKCIRIAAPNKRGLPGSPARARQFFRGATGPRAVRGNPCMPRGEFSFTAWARLPKSECSPKNLPRPAPARLHVDSMGLHNRQKRELGSPALHATALVTRVLRPYRCIFSPQVNWPAKAVRITL